MPSQGDPTDLPSLLFAQAALSLSRTQRLVSSWLPPPTEAELQAARPSSDVDKEEDGVFMPSNELAGLGAKYAEEDESASRVLRSDENLKIQLLGRGWLKRQERKGGPIGGPTLARLGSKPKHATSTVQNRTEGESDEENEGGRSSLGKNKTGAGTQPKFKHHEAAVDGNDDEGVALRAKKPDVDRFPKRSLSYLDELLAKKAEKEQKKGRRKSQHSNAIG